MQIIRNHQSKFEKLLWCAGKEFPDYKEFEAALTLIGRIRSTQFHYTGESPTALDWELFDAYMQKVEICIATALAEMS